MGIDYFDLLEDINRRLNVSYYNGDPQSMVALRNVVQLHKPFEIDREGNYNCQECEWEYPCETIKSIEKELS